MTDSTVAPTPPSRSNRHGKHHAREMAIQVLYQQACNPEPLPIVLAEWLETQNMAFVDIKYFKMIVTGVVTKQADIDAQLQRHTDRQLSDISFVELAILRLAAYELLHCLQVPYRVVINEALELTKTFGTEQGYRYVNGVLDALAKEVRASERRRGPNDRR